MARVSLLLVFTSLLALVTSGTLSFSPTKASAQIPDAGAVYVMTNQLTNAVMVFNRAADGSLTPIGTFPTGGSGEPAPRPGDPPTDPLASQGSLILSQDDSLLFAVNAGSGEVSSLSVGPSGLTLVSKVPSGGVRPISVTQRGNLLYVLNEEGTPNISGFIVGVGGALTPLAGSTRPLTAGNGPTDPAQVGFTPNGDALVVTGKNTDMIDVFRVGADGLPTSATANRSNGATPFGFAFDSSGHLIVSEAFGGAPNQAATSSYQLFGNTLFTLTGSVNDFQTAACWVVVTNGGQFAYVSNTGSNSVSSYRIAPSGTLTLLNSVAANTGSASAPIDMTLDDTSRFLYVHGGGSLSVHIYRVELDGSLTAVGSVSGIPSGAQGIVAR